MIKLFYSNHIEQLYQNLKQQLFSHPKPFERRLIIVPTPAIKSWLLLQFAKDPEMGIAAGLEFHYLEDGLKIIYDLIAQESDPYYVPSPLELTLGIENQIRMLINEWEFLPTQQRGIWQPIIQYLKIHFDSHFHYRLTKRNEKRLAALSETLARLFMEYSRYGQAMIANWPKQATDWQQDLWYRLFSAKTSNWNFPTLTYQNLKTKPVAGPVQVHLFSVSFLPKSEYELLEKANEQIPVSYYSLSPSCVFWSDILTDREASKLQKFWSRKGISTMQQQTLDHFLQNKNPLLANWGKLGRKMVEQIEQTDAEIFSHYRMPARFESREIYENFDDLVFSSETTPPHLLHYLQADILFMRSGEENEKIPIKDDEESIQFHSAPTMQREIEILYNNLLYLFEKEKTLEPGEIIVMAPDIMSYAPFIHQIFGDESSQLDFQMMDIQSLSEDSLIKQFWHFINLSFSRWSKEDLISLFDFSSFQKKHQLSPEDINEIRAWMDEIEIRWGNDADHRNEILEQRHYPPMIENTNLGTWEGGFSQLLNSLVMQNDSFSGLEADQGILLGKWIELIRLLRKDLQQLVSGQLRTYSDWIQELKRLIFTYLIHENEEEGEDLLSCLNEFNLACRWIPDQKVSFISLKKHLETYLSRKTFVYRENHLQAIKFCSMLPMRAIPAKVIAILGMNENAFPRQENRISLNLMKECSFCDYSPERVDFDRYLFLEAFLSARKYFLISFKNYAANEGKEQAPSLLITELLQYIDQNYCCEKTEKVSDLLKFKHPYDSFDFRYFSLNTPYKNFSQQAFCAAQSYYQSNKQPFHQFIHDFAQNDRMNLPTEAIIDIKQLKIAICDPIRSYFNSTLGMFIKDSEDEPEEIFVIPPLDLHQFKQKSLKEPLEPLLVEAEKFGRLPLGTFKTTAIQKIQKNITDYHEILFQMGVETKDIYEIKLHEQYDEPFYDQKGWRLPPLLVNCGQSTFSIAGTLSEVTDKGLLANIQGDKKDILKAWVEFVVLCVLIDRYQLPIKKQLLCTKSGKVKPSFFEQPEQELNQILEYYFLSLENLSPLFHEWTHDLINQNAEKFQSLFEDRLKDPFNPIRNPYIQWTCRLNCLNAKNMTANWQPKAHQLFSNLFQAWVD